MKNNKKSILILIILAVVVIGTVGVTYALYSRAITGANSKLVAGDIYMHYNETNEVTIPNLIPSETYSEDQTPFEFNITGKNTNTDNDIYYEIVLQEGSVPEEKSEENRIDDEYLKFTLIETKTGEESLPVNETVVNAKSYSDLSKGQRIWVNTIPKETTDETTISYKLYMWISDEVVIGNTSDATYDMDRWNNAFASVKINVTGDFEEKSILPDGTNGVTKLNESNNLTDDGHGNKRYSGSINSNYIYFNCKNMGKQTSDTCEMWRIVGIFKDEKEKEHIKIVKNEPLTSDYFPDTYTYEGIKYNIKGLYSDGAAYYNSKVSGTSNNDWATSGIQYYLNTESDDGGINKGYLSFIYKNYKDIIADMKYYLGNVSYGAGETSGFMGIWDNSDEAYNHERSSNSCSSSSCPGGSIWPSNQATWEGKVALLYPSDYGYASDSSSSMLWTLGQYGLSVGWLYDITIGGQNEFLLSPTSENSSNVALIGPDVKGLGGYDVSTEAAILPTLYLDSEAKLTDVGDGTSQNPYQLTK